MNSKKKISIYYNHGKKFSEISKDKNKIHLDKIEGYNSIFGSNICHGCLILIKIIKKFNISNFENFKIFFNSPFFYNSQITLIKNKKIINIFQNKKIKSKLIIDSKDDFLNFNYQKINLKKYKYIQISNYLKKEKNELFRGIKYISYFTGMICPGEYSIIHSIKITKLSRNKTNTKNKTNTIVVKKIKNSPFFFNSFFHGKYLFEFETIKRPSLTKKNQKIPNKIITKVKKFNNDILIIGASSGIGSEVLKIFKKNKIINIYATYFNNLIFSNQKNLIKIKIDIEKNLDFLKKFIKLKKIKYIYYFATPKININDNNINYKEKLKKFYIEYPIKIISSTENIKFFYPSTDFLNKKKFNSYSSIKYLGEKSIKKINQKSVILRIPEIDTKNNLSFFDRKLPSFMDYINKNNKAFKLFFFNC